MSLVADLENTIALLPPEDFVELSRWFDEQRNLRWDQQMMRDAESGGLDFLADELDVILRKGEERPLHEVLHHS